MELFIITLLSGIILYSDGRKIFENIFGWESVDKFVWVFNEHIVPKVKEVSDKIIEVTKPHWLIAYEYFKTLKNIIGKSDINRDDMTLTSSTISNETRPYRGTLE